MSPLCTSPPLEGLGEVSIHINGDPYPHSFNGNLMDFIWSNSGIRGERNYMSNYMVIICSLLSSTMFNRPLIAINGDPHVPAVHIPSFGGAWGGLQLPYVSRCVVSFGGRGWHGGSH